MPLINYFDKFKLISKSNKKRDGVTIHGSFILQTIGTARRTGLLYDQLLCLWPQLNNTVSPNPRFVDMPESRPTLPPTDTDKESWALIAFALKNSIVSR